MTGLGLAITGAEGVGATLAGAYPLRGNGAATTVAPH